MKAFLIDFSVSTDFLTESSIVDYQNSFSIVIRIPDRMLYDNRKGLLSSAALAARFVMAAFLF